MKKNILSWPVQTFAIILATSIVSPQSGALTIQPVEKPGLFEQLQALVLKTADASVEDDEDVELLKEMELCSQSIDEFFGKHNLPMAGLGEVFVESAYENGRDCKMATLVASKAFNESTGGKHTPKTKKYNAFGWNCYGSTKEEVVKNCHSFRSFEDAIRTVTTAISGNGPTDRLIKRYCLEYDEEDGVCLEGKSIDSIINTYNPPSIAPEYNGKIKRTMSQINKLKVSLEQASETEANPNTSNQISLK